MSVSIRTRLTIGYLLVLTVATLMLAGGAWWLFRASVIRAADASLAARVDGTRRFIEATDRNPPHDGLADEFQEFAELTSGETLLHVSDESGRTLCRPALAGWDQLQVPASPPSALRMMDATIEGQPFRALSTLLEVGPHRYRLTVAISMGTAVGALRRFGTLLAALVPAVLVFAAAGGFWLSGRALAPVDRMTRDAQQISVRDRTRRLEVPPADDELRRLAETFNDMLGRWQDTFADVIRFTTDASHELRTPISLARTTVDLALNRPRTNEEYRTALSEVQTHTERMSALVDDLLTLARADAGVEPPPVETVDLRDVAHSVVRNLRPAVEQRSLALQLSVPETSVPVRGSRESLRRLVLILLDNAVKYTPPQGSVRVDVSTAGSRPASAAVLEVADSGPGISAEDRPHVFDRFYRGSFARQATPDGSGLGLSIARTIVDRHGGTIGISPAEPGHGCRIAISLPLA